MRREKAHQTLMPMTSDWKETADVSCRMPLSNSYASRVTIKNDRSVETTTLGTITEHQTNNLRKINAPRAQSSTAFYKQSKTIVGGQNSTVNMTYSSHAATIDDYALHNSN